MTPILMTSIEAVPRLLLLIIGLIGLIFAIRARANGGSGLTVAAFVIMLFATVLGITWQFVVINVPRWSASAHLSISEIQLIYLSVGISLDVLAVLSWLLVALGVAKGRRPAQPAAYPGYPASGYPPVQHPPH